MRAHEFIPHNQLLESQLTPEQVRARQQAWLWAELQNLMQLARKGEAAARPKPKIHKWAWKKPAKPRKPKTTAPRRMKPRRMKPRRMKPKSGIIAPTKPQVLADPVRAQRRVAALYRR